jgi:hypothetical protein
MVVFGLELDNLHVKTKGVFMAIPKIMKEIKKRVFDTDSTITIGEEAQTLSLLNEEDNLEEEEN